MQPSQKHNCRERKQMYLTRCWLENAGPISILDIELPFNADGTPKPVVLVGGNGTGKTVVLSYVADALIEIAKKAYEDVVPGQGHSSPYLRVVGSGNTRVGASYSFALLMFEARQDDALHQLLYREQTGQQPENWNEACQQRFGRQMPWSNMTKEVEGGNETVVQDVFEGAAIAYFPSSRSERPHWYNPTVARELMPFDLGGNFRKQLGTRPIIITEAAAQNQSWLLHLVLDSRADFTAYVNADNQPAFYLNQSENELLQRRAGLDNVISVLRQILCDSEIRLAVQSRTRGIERVSIARGNEIVVPTLHHLSAGQAILFNTFLTIIRYADRADVAKSTSLHEIRGVVLIDEIDAHMHADLQHDVLPKLIKLFPRVQFIVTSHAPLFVLGMEHEFGSDGYMLLEMPDGNGISAERFSEFQRSFDYYQETKTFEDEQRERLRIALEQRTKPVVLTEGDTDPDYLRTALELLGRADLLSIIDIEWIGATRDGQPFFTGDKNLNNAAEFLRANPQFLENRHVLLLYDCDANKPNITEDNLWVRTIPRNEANRVVTKGIENLLPAALFNPEDRRFYSLIEKKGDYGQITRASEFRKRAFCDYVCFERRDATDFSAFQSVVTILEQFASSLGSLNSAALEVDPENPSVHEDR
ncbi:MAG: ATP-binding protein [Gemmatimonadetes bacterium]|nr:ATP-binding protein [Gemmatimonadota bacterium]